MTARERVLREALQFYADAWEDQFSFLGGEPLDRIPTDALAEDRGDIARAALSAHKKETAPMTVYKLTQDIVIPAGTFVNVEPPANRFYATKYASVPIEVTQDVTAEWLMDLDDAVEQGVVEAVPEENAQREGGSYEEPLGD